MTSRECVAIYFTEHKTGLDDEVGLRICGPVAFVPIIFWIFDVSSKELSLYTI